MTVGTDTVRSLRFALGRALADEAGRGRVAEALAELDRAIAEPGDDPPAGLIWLTAGEILEEIDPAQALARYVAALAGPTAETAVERARALLERSPEPTALVASLPAQAVDVANRAALASAAPDTSLLASLLLRQHGRDEEALKVLELAHAGASPPRLDVSAQMGETLLDLDRSREVLALVDREDPGKSNRSLQLLHAEAHLVCGEPEPALTVAKRLARMGERTPAVAAVTVLSLMALGRLDEALDALPAEPAPESLLTRAVLHLQRREYVDARDASWQLLRMRPTDPDSLLINAQTVVEALDVDDEQATAVSDAPGSAAASGGSRIDAARRLLKEVAAELESLGPRSRWWRAQEVLRAEDPRFQFFTCELAFATGTPPTVDQLAAISEAETSWLQDAALAERRGELLAQAGDRAAAAAAYDVAQGIFISIDLVRAAERAGSAHECEPTVERAIAYAERGLNASYEPGLEESEMIRLLDGAYGAVVSALEAADDEQLAVLLHLGAWLRGRRAEAVPEADTERSRATLAWLLAGLAAHPDDSTLRAVAASQLGDTGHLAGALAWAREASHDVPDNAYVVETAVVAAANYHEDLAAVRPFLDQHATLSDEHDWRLAVELSMCLASGDRDGMRERLGLPVADAMWTKRVIAFTQALLEGIDAARDSLQRAYDACAADTSPSGILDALNLAAVLQRADDVEHFADVVESDSRMWEEDRAWARLVRRFALDATVGHDEFFVAALPLMETPNEAYQLVHVKLPLICAARSRATGPVAPVPVDMDALHARVRTIESELAAWSDRLEREGPAMGALARLADRGSALTTCIAAADALRAGLKGRDLDAVSDRLGHLVVARAADALLKPMLEAALGRREPVEPAEVRAAVDPAVGLDPATQLAVALLADGVAAAPAPAQVVADAARRIVDRLMELEPGAASWWHLDDYFAARDHSGEAVAAVRAALLTELPAIVGLRATDERSDEARPLMLMLGPDLIPEDPGPEWRLFREMLPTLRERVRESTGYETAPVAVVPDRHYRDGLRLMIYGGPLEARRLPVDTPEGLELAIGHLEQFVRTHLGDLVSIVDVRDHASLLGADVRESVTSDAVAMIDWLRRLRQSIARGEMHDPDEAARRIANATTGPAVPSTAGGTDDRA